MKIISTWKQSVQMGLFSTLHDLNLKQKFSFLVSAAFGKICDEIRICGGGNYPDLTFYIIRRNYTKVGLFSMYNTNAGHIKYAIEKGYIPVIDMSHYKNCYLGENNLGKQNSWEYYFSQPCSYSVKEAYSGKNVVLSSINPTDIRPNDHMSFFNNIDGELDIWKDIARKYIQIKGPIWDEARQRFKEKTKGKKCLGVSIRGTDYIALEPPEHPIQPSIDMVIDDVRKVKDKYGFKYIYLCTEDNNYIQRFRSEFGDVCFVNERKLINYTNGSIIDQMMNEENDRRDNGKEYLITMLMLTMTDSVIASRASGTVAAEMIADGWDKQIIYNLGRYPKERKEHDY